MLVRCCLSGLALVAIGLATYASARLTVPVNPRQGLPDYECVIPSTIPATLVFYGLSSTPETIDAHACYRAAHREGWNECLAVFVHNRTGRKLRHRLNPSDLDLPFRQKMGLTQAARRDGYQACRLALGLPAAAPGIVVITDRENDDWDYGWALTSYRFAE